MPKAGRNKIPSIAFAALAILLLVLTTPSLAARLIRLTNDGTRRLLQENKPVAEADIIGAMRAGMSALSWSGTGETLDDMALAALAHYRLAQDEKREKLAEKALIQAIEWQSEALYKAPTNSFGWTRLAYMLIESEGPTARAAEALARSMETEPFEPSLMLTRLSMAALLFDKLDPETRAEIPGMIRAAWKIMPYELTETAQKNHFTSLVKEALTPLPKKPN